MKKVLKSADKAALESQGSEQSQLSSEKDSSSLISEFKKMTAAIEEDMRYWMNY